MAWTFGTKQAFYDDANWLDNISSLSFSVWCRIDTLHSPAENQGIFGHEGSTNYIRFQKYTNDQWHFYIKSGGVGKEVYDSTASVVQGTIYHMAVTWEKASATGLKIYRNGTIVGSAVSTATQTADYNSGGNVDFYISGTKDNNRIGHCTVESLAMWTNYVLDAGEVMALRWLGWPHLATGKQPTAYWPMSQELLTRLPDISGNARHIEAATIDSSPTAGGLLGKYEDPSVLATGGYRQSAAGPPAPNPWTLLGNVTHPTATSTVTSLVNGTVYEFSVIAKDDATPANESTRSATVEATPSTSGITYVHVPRFVWGGR
jgi:hypothetical protein